MAAAQWVKRAGLPLTVNAVLHRGNLDRVDAFVALAERLGADRLELANATFLGWALLNRDALLPSTAAMERARERARSARDRLLGRMEVLFVVPDYHAPEPKACMHGWGRRFIVVTPRGVALPCHAAHSIPDLAFSNVKELSLAEIWGSPAFEAFRGEGWMSETCRTCERRSVDFGGCRCQALQLAGDAAATDPACTRSPHHTVVTAARARADAEDPVAAPRHRTLTVLR
jgi:pyrroloquinoline quinone biosynthesis protein E